MRISWTRVSPAPAMTEEESVAVPEFLKLLLDDAGKERAHLMIGKDKMLKLTNIKSSPFHQLVQFPQDQP